MKIWLVIEEMETGGTKPYISIPLSLEDANRLKEHLIFKDEWLRDTKGIEPKRKWVIFNAKDYKNDTLHSC
jgi:hypothetical protein